MKRLKISSELFVLNHGSEYILYLPLKPISMVVNTDTIKLLNAINEGKEIDVEMDVVKKLIEIGVFDEPIYPFIDSEYKPTSVTFLPSFNCNLKCLYCFSYGGDFAYSKISNTAAHKAIDLIIKNALDFNKKEISVGFHGGGEPLLYANKTFIENVIEYTESKSLETGLSYQITAVTNGIDINKFDINWLKEKFTRFSISLDGPPDIQNFQRPRKGKDKDSYTPVLNAIQLFEKNNIDFNIRSTITKYSVKRMSEIIEHFIKITNKKSFHFEPLFECGRCVTSKFEAPTEKEFIKYFKKAIKTANSHDVKLFYSGASLGRISDRFCGAAGDNFFITPDSFVTTCLEACRIDEIENQPFLIGKYNEEFNKYEFDQRKIDFLKSRKVGNIETCTDCFCKFSCSGDCLVKVLKKTGDMFDTTKNSRCEINIALTKQMIKGKIC